MKTTTKEDLTGQPADKEKKAKKDVLKEYRVVFLGDSEAGKTLLMARLKNPRMNPAKFKEGTTNGIKIFSEEKTLRGQRVRINYWDFGGQEILNSMHRMFLSDNSLYVIVLNTRNDNQDAQANFWIRYVMAYAPKSPILLVMNKIDQNKWADLNLPALVRRFPKLRIDEPEVLRVSAIEPNKKKFREEFTNKLYQRITRCIESTRQFTPQEAKIRDTLRAREDRVIDTDTFRVICEENGLNEENYGDKTFATQDELMSRFNEAGIIVSFTKKKNNNTEILIPLLLEPEWITKTIYRILNTEKKISENGVVLHENIKKLCMTSDVKWHGSRDAYDLLDIMRAFGLSYVSGADDVQEFIPMLCQQREPEEIDDLTHAEGTIAFQMAFEYLPSGVLYHMMVKHFDKLDLPRTWRTGAKFGHDDDNYVILRQDRNTMDLYVRDADKKNAVDEIESRVKEIREYAKNKYNAKLLENKIGFEVAPEIIEYFDHDRLLKADSAEVPFVASKIHGGKVAVRDILEQEDRSEQRDLDKLLELTLKGCKVLQNDYTYWWRDPLPPEMEARLPKMDEDSRTRWLLFSIGQGFSVGDQHKSGESATGIGRGELDLNIGLKPNDYWSILEALNIKNGNAESMNNWVKHLKRLTTKYNQSGLRYLILVSYLLAPVEKFRIIKDAYHSKLSVTELKYHGIPISCKEEKPDNCPNLISISRADYRGDMGDMSLFHFLVHIPKYTGKQMEEG